MGFLNVNVVAYLVLAVLINVPMGMVRTRFRKLSPQWFIAIHAFIPFLFVFRQVTDVSPWWIPAGFAFAVAGQVIGTRIAPKPWIAIGDALNAERELEREQAKSASNDTAG